MLASAGRHSELSLVQRLRAGDRSATEHFVREHAGWMLVLAHRYVKDQALAEDCVQEAFLQAFRNISAFQGRSALKSWLYRIVINAALMRLRALHGARERPIDDALPEIERDRCGVDTGWVEMATPDAILERKEVCELVAEKLTELPDCYRIVLFLRDIEGLSTEETARMLATTEGAVKVRLHRARAAFKVLVEPILRQYV